MQNSVFSLFCIMCLPSLASAGTWMTNKVSSSDIEKDVAVTSSLRHRELQDPPRKSIPELIAGSFVLDDIEVYLVQAGLSGVLGSPDITFFFPWDFAWEALDAELIARLRSPPWSAHLESLILYHWYEGVLPPDSVQFDSNTGSADITMANGETVVLTETGSGWIIANGIDTLAQSPATNGYAYMLEEVLLPAWITSSLYHLLAASPSFPTLTQLIVTAGLDSLLDTQSDTGTYYTIFCPSEAAWAKLSLAELEHLRSPAGLSDLTTLLSSHVVGDPSPLPVAFLNPPESGFPTLANTLISVNKELAQLQIVGPTQTADMVQGDIVVAFNGIAHMISDVLWLPPAFCSVNPVCQLLGLDGLCCNTVEGVQLDCCDPPPLCVDNPACLAETLLASCCPTDDNVFLECCAVQSESPSASPTAK